MAPFVATAKNAMLDAVTIDLMSLHSGYTADGTANEVPGTGGSPNYARKACVFAAASAGARNLNADVVFDIPPGATVRFIGLWTNAGTVFRGLVPNGSVAAKPFVLDDTTADTFKVDSHGFTSGASGDCVVLWGSSLPTGVTEGTLYWVINGTANAFQVSTTQNGSAVAITTAGHGAVQKVIAETFASQGTFTVKAAGSTAIDLNAI